LTDASGYYGFGAPDEAYTFDVQPPAGSHLVPDHETGFVVSGGTKKDVELASGNMLSVTVYAPGGTKPVAGAWVSLYNRVSDKSYGVLTDANGHYSIIQTIPCNRIRLDWRHNPKHNTVSIVNRNNPLFFGILRNRR
jgi:hypothetical protein